MSESYVIIGDGIAGSSAAETLREEAPDADITVLTDEGEPLYNRILIKEFAKGKLPEAPVSIHEEGWYDERDIDLELNTYVTGVDEDAHEVPTHEGDTYEYDKLLVASASTTPTPMASTTSGRSRTPGASASTRNGRSRASSSGRGCSASTSPPSVAHRVSTRST